MRSELVSIQKITELCKSLNLDQDIVYRKAEILIDNYHDIIWVDTEKAKSKYNVQETADQKDPNAALLYLADLNPSGDKKNIRNDMFMLFEAQWLRELIDSVKEYVMTFSEDGSLYCDILDKELAQVRITAHARQKAIGAGKSSFYRKRKGAILLFGVSLWGILIPYWLKYYHLSECRAKAPPDIPNLKT